ncbi:MAG: lysylphosphatidylglycerol synthase domain-containing protein, partial [Actinoallomurus sp.]
MSEAVAVAVAVAVAADHAVPPWAGTGPAPADRTRRGRRLRWAARVAALGALLACVVVLRDRLPDPDALWQVTIHAGPGWLACAVVAQLASMSMFARVQRRLLRAGGVRMSLPRAIRMTYAGNALSTTLPAGPAISVAFNFRQYRRAGAPVRLATSVVLLGGLI